MTADNSNSTAVDQADESHQATPNASSQTEMNSAILSVEERQIDVTRLEKAINRLVEIREADQRNTAITSASTKVIIQKEDLDEFIHETGCTRVQAEGWFKQAQGSLQEALHLWLTAK